MRITDIQRTTALYDKVGQYVHKKRAKPVVNDTSAVYVTVSQEAKALAEAAEAAEIQRKAMER